MQKKWEIIKGENINYDIPSNSHPILNKLLANLGIEKHEVTDFLNPSLDNLNDPFLLADIDDSTNTIIDAIKNDKKIVIHGDFDVDGIVATSIFWDFLSRKLGGNIIPIIPDRFSEGYGLSTGSIERIKEQNADLVITVDCGIKDLEIIKENPKIDFIITDHHSYPITLKGKKKKLKAKNLKSIIHPAHPEGKYPYKEICGATVTWKLISALHSQIINGKFDVFDKEKIKELKNFDPNSYLEIVALATVTDIMPLKGENRIILKHGLELLKTTDSIGLNSLFEKIGVNKSLLDTYHFGFVIGPRLNAAGRMDDAIEGVRLLCTNNTNTAKKLAEKLDNLNEERKRITYELLEIAENEIKNLPKDQKLYFIHGEEWPDGILGLVAGKIQEKYNKPILVASINPKDNMVKGSARSFSGFNVTEAIDNHKDLMWKYGGHVQAAGYSFPLENLEKFKKGIISYANEIIKKEDLIPILKIAAKLKLSDLDENLINTIEILAPFGNGNPRPKFLFENLEITEHKLVGQEKSHISLTLNDEQNTQIKAIGFNLAEEFNHINVGDRIDLVGIVKLNNWNGNKSVQIEIKDLRHSE